MASTRRRGTDSASGFRSHDSDCDSDALIELSERFYDEVFDPQSLDEWIEMLEEVELTFPDELRFASHLRARRAAISVDRIFACGEVQGTCRLDRSVCNVFFSVTDDETPAGCNCTESSGTKPCEHSYVFVREVLQGLKNDSQMRRRFRTADHEATSPPRLQYSEKVLSPVDQLNAIVRERRDDAVAVAEQHDDVLAKNVAVNPRRICWDITVDAAGYLDLKILLQQRRKRGDGFNRGKRISLKSLMTDRNLPLTPADEAVISRVQVSRSYYYGEMEYELSPLDALVELVGQDNVLLGGCPVEVKRSPVYLTLGKTDDGHRLMISDATATHLYQKVIGSDRVLLRIDSERSEMVVWSMSKDHIELLRSLIRVPAVEDGRKEELIESLAELQKQISVVLPEDRSYETIVEDAKPAVLLRSNDDGSLDVGLRIRDVAGVLRKPLSGPMVTTIDRDGQKVQVIRCAQREQQQQQRIAHNLGVAMDEDTWTGTVREFATGLQLIEQLQSPECEIEALWDRNCKKPITVLGHLSSKNVRVEITTKRNWFGVTGECQFDSQTIAIEDLVSGLSGQAEEVGGFVKLVDGQWARISSELRRRLGLLQNVTHSERKTLRLDATAAPVVRELAESDITVKAGRAWTRCLKRLDAAESLDPTIPKGLDAGLRDYQMDGFRWLRKLAEWGVGGILADDMGLGKTLQTLAVLLDRADEGPALVIAPTSVGFNWVREAERFTPDLEVHLYRETARADFLPTLGPRSLVICSYGLALRDAEALSEISWSTLVLDEAQAIKNSRSKTSKAIAKFQSDWTVALTGTPVENHLGELWSLFHIVSPGVFGGWEHFKQRYASPIEKDGSETARQSLADRLRPFVLRRTKQQVLSELPPRTDMDLYVDLSAKERAEYEKVRRVAIGELDEIESMPQSQDKRFKILALMTRLRQISCHAGLVNQNWSGSSAKLDQLCETLESLREEGHRALVFSQFTEYLGLIRQTLESHGFTYEYLDGSTPAKSRQKAVDRFQTGNADAFLISLKAGGTGLNLTAADYVIHMDPWWNPAVEDQATDRAHRIGQENPVMVYRIIARSTIEEEILALHETKRDLVEGVMRGTQAAAKLSNEDLIRMLRS